MIWLCGTKTKLHHQKVLHLLLANSPIKRILFWISVKMIGVPQIASFPIDSPCIQFEILHDDIHNCTVLHCYALF